MEMLDHYRKQIASVALIFASLWIYIAWVGVNDEIRLNALTGAKSDQIREIIINQRKTAEIVKMRQWGSK